MTMVTTGRYAQALFGLAKQQKVLDQVQSDFSAFLSSCKATPSLAAWLRNPQVRVATRQQVLSTLKGILHPTLWRFFLLVVKKRRCGILPAIGVAFLALYKQHNNMKVAQITVAYPLPEDVQQKLVVLIKKMGQGATVEIVTKVDSTLLGGYVLRLGDYFLDTSLRTSLRQLSNLWQRDSFGNDSETPTI